MNNQFWSWILTAVGLTGFILAGRKIWWCWYINIAAQGLWLTYALMTKQYGFIAASIFYAIVFGQNAIRWTKEHPQKSLSYIEILCGETTKESLIGSENTISHTCILMKHDISVEHKCKCGTTWIKLKKEN